MKPLTTHAFAAFLCILAPLPAAAALVTYTLTGGGASADVDGTAFIADSYSITATADTGTIISGSWNGFPVNYNPVTPTITLLTPGDPVTLTLLPIAGYSWVALAGGDVSGRNHGFFLFRDLASEQAAYSEIESAPGVYSDLTTPNSYSGSIQTTMLAVSTSGGPLDLISDPFTGSFTISSVPEPTTATATLLSSLAGTILVSRRRRSS